MKRLNTISPELNKKMERLQIASQKNIAFTACRYALNASAFDSEDVIHALLTLENGQKLNQAELDALREQSIETDELYFEQHENDNPNYLTTFSYARVLSALLFLVEGEYSESVYESLMAVEDNTDLLNILDSK